MRQLQCANCNAPMKLLKPNPSWLNFKLIAKWDWRSCEKTNETQCLEVITKARRAGVGAWPYHNKHWALLLLLHYQHHPRFHCYSTSASKLSTKVSLRLCTPKLSVMWKSLADHICVAADQNMKILSNSHFLSWVIIWKSKADPIWVKMWRVCRRMSETSKCKTPDGFWSRQALRNLDFLELGSLSWFGWIDVFWEAVGKWKCCLVKMWNF